MRMMGSDGLRRATETAILSANYIAARLADHYELHFSGNIAGIKGGGVAHECILDLRPLKDATEQDDIVDGLPDLLGVPLLPRVVPAIVPCSSGNSNTMSVVEVGLRQPRRRGRGVRLGRPARARPRRSCAPATQIRSALSR